MIHIALKPFSLKILSALIIGGISFYLAWSSYQNNDYQWVYPLDDTYIHLSIAQNLWHHGNWSVVPEPFQFSSSSPLYSILILLSGAWIDFPHYLPLVINCLIGIGFFLWLGKCIFQKCSSPLVAFLIFVSFLLLLPFHLLLLLGMEHLLHVWLSLLFFQEVIPAFWNEDKNAWLNWRVLLIVTLLSLIRYESLFLIVASTGVLFTKRQFKKGIILGFMGGILVLILGLFFWIRGATFFPLSVLVKSALIQFPENIFSKISYFIAELYDNPFMLVLFLGLISIPVIARLFGKNPTPLLIAKIIICLLAMLFHMLSALIGGYRLEAYLIGIGLILIIEGYVFLLKGVSWEKSVRIWALVGLAIWSFPLIIRASFFSQNFVLSTQNIYQQQIQMAHFTHKFYPNACIAANDIGAITYFNEITLLDFALISDQKLYETYKKGNWSAQEVEKTARNRGVSIAIVYDSFTYVVIPKSWQKVATWTIPDNFICGDETVTFYAVTDEAKTQLRPRLETFSKELPVGVKIEYFGD